MKVAAIFICLILFTAAAEAQQRPPAEIKGTAGWIGFLDEDILNHGVFGGAVRYYLTPGIGIEPEFLYMIGPGDDRDITLIPHITFDFARSEKVRPYFIGGVGWMYHTDRVGPFNISANDWVVNGGIGVKLFITPRMFVAPEYRMGFETIVRATASVGFTF
jgi:hypothetical protein